MSPVKLAKFNILITNSDGELLSYIAGETVSQYEFFEDQYENIKQIYKYIFPLKKQKSHTLELFPQYVTYVYENL